MGTDSFVLDGFQTPPGTTLKEMKVGDWFIRPDYTGMAVFMLLERKQLPGDNYMSQRVLRFRNGGMVDEHWWCNDDLDAVRVKVKISPA